MKKEKKHIELPRKAVIASSQQYFLIILGVIAFILYSCGKINQHIHRKICRLYDVCGYCLTERKVDFQTFR